MRSEGGRKQTHHMMFCQTTWYISPQNLTPCRRFGHSLFPTKHTASGGQHLFCVHIAQKGANRSGTDLGPPPAVCALRASARRRRGCAGSQLQRVAGMPGMAGPSTSYAVGRLLLVKGI